MDTKQRFELMYWTICLKVDVSLPVGTLISSVELIVSAVKSTQFKLKMFKSYL